MERLWIVDGHPGPEPFVSPLESDPSWERQVAELELVEPMSWVRLTVRRYERRRTGDE